MTRAASFATKGRLCAVAACAFTMGLAESIAPGRVRHPMRAEVGFLASLVCIMVATFALAELGRRAVRGDGGPTRARLASFVEGCALAAWALFADPPASMSKGVGVAIVTAFGLLLVGADVLRSRAPRTGAVAALGLSSVAMYAHLLVFNLRLKGPLHAVLLYVAVSCVAHAVESIRPSTPVPAARVLPWVLGAIVGAHAMLGDVAVRARFFAYSAQGPAAARPVTALTDFDRDGGAPVLGGVDCMPFDPAVGPFAYDVPGDGRDQDCDGTDPGPGVVAPPVVRGVAVPPDVLVVSVDALRADAAHTLARTHARLRGAFRFTRATSPAPRTQNSFAAMVRGRSVDAIPFDRARLQTRLAPGGMPTVGTHLRAAGIEAGFVATHTYLAPRMGMLDGFTEWRRAVMPYDGRTTGGHDSMLAADDAIDLLLERACAVDGPVLAWTHLMETHAPYRIDDAHRLTPDRVGYLEALRHQDVRLVRAVDAFERCRGRPAIVVVLGDHGESFGEHGVHHHSSTVHAEQVRVPLLVRVPGRTGRRIDAPVSTGALAATLVELTGAGNEPSMQLRSLVPCMEDDAACPEVSVSDVFNIGLAGDVSMRGYTTRHARILVDRAHDLALHFDADRDRAEVRPRATSATEAMRTLHALDDGRRRTP